MTNSVSDPMDHAAVQSAIYEWSTYIDNRDWAALRNLLTDSVHIDYSSNDSVHGDMPAEQWIDRLRALHGFDATLHMTTNHVITVDGDKAGCRSYVNAMHFLTEGEREYHAHACGVYEHALERHEDGWKISAVIFHLAGRQSGSAAFDEAFARARELAPERQPRS